MNFMKNINGCIIASIITSLLFIGCQKDIPVSSEQSGVEENSKSDSVTDKEDDHSENENLLTDSIKLKKVFAGGVSLATGWQDVDKLQKPEDYMACWLITASNMIAWWQNRYIETGRKLPEDTPFGKGSGPYQSAIFDEAILCFDGMELGGNINAGLDWYINGTADGISNHSQPRYGTGGYLKTIDPDFIRFSKRPFSNYSNWEKASTHMEALQIFSDQLIEQLTKGCVIGLDIKTHVGLGGALHAITMWGAEVDEENMVTKVYITDSDDYEQRLVECKILAATDDFQSKVITMQLPNGKIYPQGATWEILRLFYLIDPLSL